MGRGDTDGHLAPGFSNLCLVRWEAALPAQQLVTCTWASGTGRFVPSPAQPQDSR